MVPTALAAQPGDSIQSVLDTARNEHRVKALNELFRAEFNGDPVKAVGYAREALNYVFLTRKKIIQRRGYLITYLFSPSVG